MFKLIKFPHEPLRAQKTPWKVFLPYKRVEDLNTTAQYYFYLKLDWPNSWFECKFATENPPLEHVFQDAGY